MRLNYYMFPEDGSADDNTRYDEGADGYEGYTENGQKVCTKAGYTVGGISVSHAKELLKKYGGHAWTEHIERNGAVFEITDIEIGKNNSRFKYNRHL